jgi:hypothetical protein
MAHRNSVFSSYAQHQRDETRAQAAQVRAQAGMEAKIVPTEDWKDPIAEMPDPGGDIGG